MSAWWPIERMEKKNAPQGLVARAGTAEEGGNMLVLLSLSHLATLRFTRRWLDGL